MVRTCSAHGKIKNADRRLVGKRKGKRKFGGHRRRWKDNSKIDLKETV